MVLEVALACSDLMLLRATSTVLSMDMAYYKKTPTTFWINLSRSSGRSSVSSSSSTNCTLAPYVGRTWCCGGDFRVFLSWWRKRWIVAVTYPGMEKSTVRLL